VRRDITRVHWRRRPRHIVLRMGSVVFGARRIVLWPGPRVGIGTSSVSRLRRGRVGIATRRPTIRGWIVRRTGLSRWNRPLESCWPRCCRDRRSPMIDRCSQIRVRACHLHLLRLRSYRRNMPVPSGCLVLRPGTRRGAAVTAVIADPVHGGCIVYHRCVVNVADVRDVYIVDGLVVVEAPIVPASALIAFSKVAVSVHDSAIETHMRSPIAIVENVTVAIPGPVPRRPQVAYFRRFHPGAGNPVIVAIIVVIGPIARHPDIPFCRTRRLFVYRQRRRTETHCNADLCKRCSSDQHHHHEREQDQTNRCGNAHRFSSWPSFLKISPACV